MATNDPPPGSYTYAQAGVSIDAGNALVRAIGPLVKATRRPGADAEIGGFGGFFDPKAAGYADPLLVAANDGVGTKLKLAIDHDRHDTVGIDLVAMCANDLIVQGAEPLFFLDYFATGKLDTGVAERVIAGIAQGCSIAGCALIGDPVVELAGGEIVEEEQRLGALHDQVVGAHRHEVDADGVVPAGLDRELELGADPIVGRDQQGICVARRLGIEEPAEAADLGVGAGPPRRPDQRPDRLDQRVAGVDRNARFRVCIAVV